MRQALKTLKRVTALAHTVTGIEISIRVVFKS
jgi:hypothetical protein